MEANHLDSDVLLPSRKRLHARSNKQNGDNNQGMHMGWDLNRLDSRISYLLKGHLSSENPTQEEIVEASRAVVDDAVKAAMAAKVVAQEKAVVAQKAMAAAKKALELVASGDDGNKMEQMLKNKKKHVDVEKLCNGKKPRLDNGKVKMAARASAQEKAGVVARDVAAAEKSLRLVANGDDVGKAKAMFDQFSHVRFSS
nr:hypothetical protein [Tanacetum cinerariifolium]